MEIQSRTSSRSVFVWRIIAITSIVGHIFFIWLSSLSLHDNIPIIYWQKYSNYFIYLRLLTFVLGLIAIWFSSEPKVHAWMTFLALIGSCLILGFVNFTSLFVVNVVNHVGTVELRSKVYQLVSVAKYDDETAYYLGACDESGYRCTFHQIYALFLFGPQLISKFELSDNEQELIVKLNRETVYSFDGEKSTCKDSDYGYCVKNLP